MLTCQWWNTESENACPWVCVLKSVSNPKLSMAGMKALMVYRGEPGTGASCVTWPLYKFYHQWHDQMAEQDYFTVFSPTLYTQPKRNQLAPAPRQTNMAPSAWAWPSKKPNILLYGPSEWFDHHLNQTEYLQIAIKTTRHPPISAKVFLRGIITSVKWLLSNNRIQDLKFSVPNGFFA